MFIKRQLNIKTRTDVSGADPGFEKGGGAGGSEAGF